MGNHQSAFLLPPLVRTKAHLYAQNITTWTARHLSKDYANMEKQMLINITQRTQPKVVSWLVCTFSEWRDLQKQYERRTNIEITGISQSVEDDAVEDAVLGREKGKREKRGSDLQGHGQQLHGGADREQFACPVPLTCRVVSAPTVRRHDAAICAVQAY